MVKTAAMAWVEAMLKGQRVFARAGADGSLAVEDGRVEVRYKANDGRAYRAAARNLEVIAGSKVLPDETCSAAAAAPSAAQRSAAADATSAEAGAWVAYTDGACSGNPGPAGAGVVAVSPDGKSHELVEYLGEATNNVAELTAILRALEWIPASAGAVIVRTDSQYAIGVLQKGWKAKVDQELVGRAKEVVRARHARLVYVPGHQGVALNERADQLAREAVQTRRNRVDTIPG